MDRLNIAVPSIYKEVHVLGDDQIMNFIIENANLTRNTKINGNLIDARDFGEETDWNVGPIIGIIFTVVAIVVICFYIFRWKRKKLAPNQPSTRVELHLDEDNEIILLVRKLS